MDTFKAHRNRLLFPKAKSVDSPACPSTLVSVIRIITYSLNLKFTCILSLKRRREQCGLDQFPPISNREQHVAERPLFLSPVPPALSSLSLSSFFYFSAFSLFTFLTSLRSITRNNRTGGKGAISSDQKKGEDQITTSCLSHKFRLCSVGKMWSCNETRADGISDHLTNKCHHTWHTGSSVTLTRL